MELLAKVEAGRVELPVQQRVVILSVIRWSKTRSLLPAEV